MRPKAFGLRGSSRLNPRPLSRTLNVTVPSARPSATSTRCAFACRATLVSDSCKILNIAVACGSFNSGSGDPTRSSQGMPVRWVKSCTSHSAAGTSPRSSSIRGRKSEEMRRVAATVPSIIACIASSFSAIAASPAGSRSEGKATSSLRAAQGFLGLDPFGDIAQDYRVELLSAFGDLRDRGVDGEFSPAASQARDDALGAHAARGDPGFTETPDVAFMFGAEAFGNEPGERSADRLSARAAEHRFGRSVEHHDPLFFIDRDDGVHGRFDDARHTGFDVLQRS